MIQLTPCSGVVNVDEFTHGIEVDVSFLQMFLALGVYHVGGPDWEETEARICGIYSGIYPDTAEAFCNAIDIAGSGQAISVMMQVHYTQNSEVGKFQDLIDIDDWINNGTRDSEAVDLSRIDKVPIEYFTHYFDELCPFEQAKGMFNKIQAPITFKGFGDSIGPEGNHQDVTGLNKNNRWYNYMLDSLQPVSAL